MYVSIVFLFFMFASFVSAQQMGQEFILDTSVVYNHTGGDQDQPQVIFDGTNYLVVYRDTRRAAYDIYSTRISTNGIVIDTIGIPVCTAPYRQFYPSLGFDRTNYLLVWGNERDASFSYYIYGCLMTSEGEILDTFEIFEGTGYQSQPKVAFNGTNYLVVWLDVGSFKVYGARVTPYGEVLDPNGILIGRGWMEPCVTSDSTNYFVAWVDMNTSVFFDVYGMRIGSDGALLDTEPIEIATGNIHQYAPSVAFDGTNYLVIWRDRELRGARVTTEGVVVDSDGFIVSDTPGYSSATFNGINYFVTWASRDTVWGTRVTSEGTILDSVGIFVSDGINEYTYPSVTSSEECEFVVWSKSELFSDIYGARIDSDGNLIDTLPIPLSMSAQSQYHPRVAFDGLNYLALWEDYHTARSLDIYGTRVNQEGIILDPYMIKIASSPARECNSDIASGNENCLVVWESYTDDSSAIYGTRIAPDGTVLDSEGFLIASRGKGPKVAFDMVNYMVIWQDMGDLYGTRISQDGGIIDSPRVYANSAFSPDICFGDSNYLIVWRHHPTYWISDLFGLRITPGGEPLDTVPVILSEKGDIFHYYSTITFDGTNYLVIWENVLCPYGKARTEEMELSSLGISGIRVSPDGELLDTSDIEITTTPGYRPSAIFDGENYWVAWDDYRNGYFDIFGAIVSTAGKVIGGFQFISPNDRTWPSLAFGSNDEGIIVYSGFMASPYNSMRIHGAILKELGIESEPNIGGHLKLVQSYPNPFISNITIRWVVPKDTNVSLRVYDTAGRLVKTLVNAVQIAGYYTIKWDGKDDTGRQVRSGVYFLKIVNSDVSGANSYMSIQELCGTVKVVKLR